LQSQDEKKHIISMETVIDLIQMQCGTCKTFSHFGSTNPGDYFCEGTPKTELIDVWAPDTLPTQPPPQIGIPLGGPTGYLSFAIQFHYDNRGSTDGILDSTGVRFYHTRTVRHDDQGVLFLGDPTMQIQLKVKPVDGRLTQHSFPGPLASTRN
jgi:hypothetical protein